MPSITVDYPDDLDRDTVEKMGDATSNFFLRFGRVPLITELLAFMHREERKFVGCQFAGNDRVYTYELPPGATVVVGDYLKVWSPWTGRNELVRVHRLGRGSWRGSTKVAWPVRWKVIGAGGAV